MKAFTKTASWSVAAASAIAVLTVGVILPAVSSAATIGSLTFTPPTGTDQSSISIVSSGPCTDPSATNLQAKVTGAGFPAAGKTVVGNAPISAFTTGANGGYTVPLAETMKDFANEQNPPAFLSGAYQFTLTCRTNTSGASLGDFTGSLYFSNNSSYTSTAPSSSPTPNPSPTASGQKLTLKTVSNRHIGPGKGQVTLQATATPAGSGASVTFYRRSGMTGKVVPAGNSAVDGNGIAVRVITGNSGAIQLIYSVLQPKPGFNQVRSGDVSYKIA